MSIIIQNISKEYSKTKVQDYVVKINDKEIVTFQHIASDGLADCLLKASNAVRNKVREDIIKKFLEAKNGV